MSLETSRARVFAFYLPQFHPIAENDERWGKGFTEWTNVAKAKPFFPGHRQPRIPADLGFYDLRLAETRNLQAELARSARIEGFCYWHYWMGNGRRLLETPFEAVLQTGEPDFPFCLGWANHDWTGVWFGSPEIHVKQEYPGEDDHRRHFEEALLPAFLDSRYLQVQGRPIFVIYNPHAIPNTNRTTDLFRKLARDAGFDDLHIVGHSAGYEDKEPLGLDAVIYSNHRLGAEKWPRHPALRFLFDKVLRKLGYPKICPYEEASRWFLRPGECRINEYPCLVPQWDTTPRLRNSGVVIQGSTPARFGQHVRDALSKSSHLPEQHRIFFLTSWNEWAEGNYMEPDTIYGRGYLDELASALRTECFD